MPQSKRSYRIRKARRARRKYNKRSNRLGFRKAPMPNKFATKLRYSEYSTLNTGAGGTAAAHVVKANGLYDPNYTGTGHQPRGFDQLMTMYDHFTVIGAKISVDWSTNSSASIGPLQVGISVKDSATTYSDGNDYAEGRNVVSRVIRSTSASGNAGYMHLSKQFSTAKFLGRSKVLADPELKGSVSADPTEGAYFHIWCAPLSTNDEPALTIKYRVDYLVVFTEPKQPDQS